jgi:hypothetical protein
LSFQQLEFKIKLYEITHSHPFQLKRKQPRRQLSKIDEVIEDITKSCIPEKQKAEKLSENSQIDRPFLSVREFDCTSDTESVGLRNLTNNRIPSKITKSKSHFEAYQNKSILELESTEHFSSIRCEKDAGNKGHEWNDESSVFMQMCLFKDTVMNKELNLTIPEQTLNPQTQNIDISSQLPSGAEFGLDQCNLPLHLLGTDHLNILQTEDESDFTSPLLSFPSQIEDIIPPTLPPMTVTTNMGNTTTL